MNQRELILFLFFCNTCRTSTSSHFFLNDARQEIFSIMICQFCSRRNIFDSKDENTALNFTRFTIWFARMIDAASFVFRDISQDSVTSIYLKQILSTNRVCNFVCHFWTNILDHLLSPTYIICRIQTNTCG